MREKEISEGLGDLAHRAEKDHEVQMARADLYKIAKYSIKLHEMLKGVSEQEGLEGWVQSKITKAADYLGSVYHHLDYEQASGELGESVDTCGHCRCEVGNPKPGCDCKEDCHSPVTEARDTHCSDKCCGSDVKAEDCTCSPDCKHCNCNAVTEAAEEKATCGCDSSCSHCGGKHTMNEVGKKCSCCDNVIKAVTAEGKSPHKKGTKKYKKHMAAMHAESLQDRLAAKLESKKKTNERSLTKGEEGKREKYVKGMKKAKGDFKKRYGKDAEAVMYATATKMAKK